LRTHFIYWLSRNVPLWWYNVLDVISTQIRTPDYRPYKTLLPQVPVSDMKRTTLKDNW